MGFKDQSSKSSFWYKLRQKSPSKQSSDLLPESWQCVTHLRLLRAFAHLKNELVNVYTQQPALDSLTEGLSEIEKGQIEDDIRALVWQTYLEKAADRFESWWKFMTPKNENSTNLQVNMNILHQPGKLEAIVRDTKPLVWTEAMVPPLDVIMIWHSYMLNPRCYLEDCIRFNMLPLWKAGMPWRILGRLIDPKLSILMTPPNSQWSKKTGHKWDIREESLDTTIPCPICNTSIKSKSIPSSLNNELLERSKSTNAEVPVFCSVCNLYYNDNQLKIFKFRQAIENLRQNNVPMPGTILNVDGLAQSVADIDTKPGLLILNKFLQGEIGTQLLVITDPAKIKTTPDMTVQDLKALIEDATACSPNPPLQTALRRSVLQASDSYSMFALDLPAAVIRQGVFIEKMEEIDWLHSPALNHTMNSLISRYAIFFKIMEQNKNHVAVPTYAVDLAWHTHQLSPSSYYTFSVANAGNVFIDHDDRIQDGVRTDAFEWTSKQYQALTNGNDYGECLCWYCASAHDVANNPSPALVHDDDGHVRIDAGSRLDKLILRKIAAKQYEKLEDDFRIACRVAGMSNQSIPNQKDYLESYNWPYTKAIPAIGS